MIEHTVTLRLKHLPDSPDEADFQESDFIPL